MTEPLDDDLPTVELTVYLTESMTVVAAGCGLDITVGPARLTICPQDLEPTAAEVDVFERLADAVLEVRGALRDAYRSAR